MDQIIVALDVEDAEQARSLVKALGESASFYKVGMELYAAEGMPFVRELIEQGKDVFIDLKLYDIPETVKRATARIAQSGARFLTVHGNAAGVRAAVAGRGSSSLQLLAVTVLTSFSQQDIADMGYRGTVPELVALSARNAVGAGADGLICSPLEAANLRNQVGSKPILVTPGVRSAGAPQGDQKRVATPLEAIRNGATHLVIGREVTRASDPHAALSAIREQIAAN